MKLKNKKMIHRSKNVYNLHIKNDHNYIVSGAVVENCHGSKAEELRKLTTKVFKNAQIRWGLTGTVPREEYAKCSLMASIGRIVEGPNAQELQELGILSDCFIDILQIGCDMKFKDFHSEKKYLHSNKDHLTWLANTVQMAKENGNTLILVNLIKTGQLLEEMIPGSIFVDGSMKSTDRKKEYSAFKHGNNQVIIASYGVASTGIDLPRIFNLFLFEPGKSFVRTVQSIGRGLRKAHDKDSVNIFDICASTKYSKRHLTERKKYYKEQGFKFKVTKVKI